MKKPLLISVLLLLLGFQFHIPLFAQAAGTTDSYQENMEQVFVRGLKNVLGAPLEIPLTVQKYHEQSGRPVFRHTAGFFDGTFRMVSRAGSGIWDFIAACLPGYQEGLPVTPETLF